MVRMLIYYISAHGYGHGVRSCDILNAFHRLRPSIPIQIVSALPPDFFRYRLEIPGYAHRSAAFDVGMVQLDSIRVDVAATLNRIESVYADREALVRGEVEYLRSRRAGVVIADIPAIPLEAAAEAKIPRVAASNFAWNWIYSAFVGANPRWSGVVSQLEDGYGQTDLLLRLPFAEPMRIFPIQVDLPLLCRPGRDRRAELAQLTGAPPDSRWVLLSFTSLEWDEAALDRVRQLKAYAFFTVRPLEWNGPNIHVIDRETMSFSDVVATVDVVLSKPGYGIVSECVVNQKPLVYADRTDFIEYPILVRGIEAHLQNRHIPAEELYSGELSEALESVSRSPLPKRLMPSGGAEIAARKISDLLG